MDDHEISYLAGLVDARSRISVVRIAGSQLPRIAVSSPDPRLAQILGKVTAIKPIRVIRNYDRMGCDQHCEEKHLHVFSQTSRWSVTGAKATVMLSALIPYLQLQLEEAQHALDLGIDAPRKPSTARKMTELGWPLPVEWQRKR